MMYPDRIEIIPVTVGDTYGEQTTKEHKYCKAYIENNSKEIFNSEGIPIQVNMLILTPYTPDLKVGNMLKIVSIQGRKPIGNEEGDKEIKGVKSVGNGRGTSHMEVFI